MSLNQKSTKAFKLSTAAGALIVSNAAALGVVAKWFPMVMPTIPGTTGNDPAVLFTLSAIGLTLGLLILLGATMLRKNPSNRKVWGIMIAAFSAPSVIMGGGFIVGFLIGIYGGAFALRSERQPQTAKPRKLLPINLESNGMKIEGSGPKIMAPMFVTFAATALVSFLLKPMFNFPMANTGWTLWLGIMLLAIGVPFWLSAVAMFLKAWQKGQLETRGPFAVMPNPIYGSFILFVIPAISLWLNWWPVLLTSIVMFAVQQKFIPEEDKALKEKFGKQYEEYRRKVLLKFL